MSDNIRHIHTAPTAKAHQRAQQQQEREDAARFEARAQAIAAILKERGATVITCTREEWTPTRRLGRRAGEIINRRVRTKAVETGIAVWDTERETNPLHQRLDERRAMRIMAAYYKENPLSFGANPDRPDPDDDAPGNR
ncbi:hypothetical protein [Nocardiopsis ansamitocini]|uniref:Uncharacterized protein n=1 Tax=Nocardiopsis ansamitocini TaxID=1670832 RepID=A0A9W6PAJ0_9ACTN|nr:hypothetical protein [Nocardiopsis ansamitocini]GLU49987.1 hypothetical protein Nans01_43380 [Nocardiopsis ansamitocini]